MRLSVSPRVSFAILALAAACGDAARTRDPARDALPLDSVQSALEQQPPSHIDSIFPPEEEARRFRLEVGDSTETLRHAAPTRDALVERFRVAVEKNDRAALGQLTMNAAEFGSLVYLSSRYGHPPYFLKPQTAWFQLSANSNHDADILLRKFGGKPMRIDRVACADTALVEGQNRLWDGCRVRLKGDTTGLQLFGVILERDKRFKFLSLANKL